MWEAIIFLFLIGNSVGTNGNQAKKSKATQKSGEKTYMNLGFNLFKSR